MKIIGRVIDAAFFIAQKMCMRSIKKNKKPTIDDVAALAGVGRTSVSRVLNNGANISPALREKVNRAVKALNFEVNQQARSLARGSSRTFAMIIASDFDNEPNSYYSSAIELGALRVCTDNGYQLHTHNINQNSGEFTTKIKEILERNNYDGLIITPPFSDNIDIVQMVKNLEYPLVCISAGPNTNQIAASIGIDDAEAGYEITKHLLLKGHRTFAYIQGLEMHISAESRFAGFLRAIKEFDIAENNIIVKRGNFTFKSGIENAQAVFESKNIPTAMVCANDDMAAGALLSAHKFGIKVPDEISIVGFDDTPVSQIVWPPLTTVHQPLKIFGTKAVNMLFDQIGKPVQIKFNPIFAKFEIMERDSVK